MTTGERIARDTIRTEKLIVGAIICVRGDFNKVSQYCVTSEIAEYLANDIRARLARRIDDAIAEAKGGAP